MRSTQSRDNRRRRRGLIAGALGISLLMGGSFALWSHSATMAGGTITNGNLDIAALSGVAYWDVSQDRADATATAPVTGINGHSIADIAAYDIVPGDVIQANYGFSVGLLGDNMVADLTAKLASDANVTAAAAQGVTFKAQAWYLSASTWTKVGSAPVVINPGSTTTIDLGKVQAANQLNGSLDAGIPVISRGQVDASADTANVVVVVTGTFDSATSDQTSTLAQSVLGDVTIDLAQVRS